MLHIHLYIYFKNVLSSTDLVKKVEVNDLTSVAKNQMWPVSWPINLLAADNFNIPQDTGNYYFWVHPPCPNSVRTLVVFYLALVVRAPHWIQKRQKTYNATLWELAASRFSAPDVIFH
jgi:hypothetical protein